MDQLAQVRIAAFREAEALLRAFCFDYARLPMPHMSVEALPKRDHPPFGEH